MDKDQANNAIKGAWIAATISAGLTLIFAVTGLFGLDLSALWIVIFMLGLAFGIFKVAEFKSEQEVPTYDERKTEFTSSYS
ncbi:hypothetical protein ES708_26069 [subsurface metagenome]